MILLEEFDPYDETSDDSSEFVDIDGIPNPYFSAGYYHIEVGWCCTGPYAHSTEFTINGINTQDLDDKELKLILIELIKKYPKAKRMVHERTGWMKVRAIVEYVLDCIAFSCVDD